MQIRTKAPERKVIQDELYSCCDFSQTKISMSVPFDKKCFYHFMMPLPSLDK